jgi:hypothetical protein
MTTDFLYYAGLRKGGIVEQIGLAISENGGPFERVHGDGLILARDERIPWRDTRVCNPAVYREGNAFRMYYHGAQGTPTGKTVTHSIGTAWSRDGIAWDVVDEPALSWRDMIDIDPSAAESRGVGVIEPCLRTEGSTQRMWFVYWSTAYPNNALFTASSTGGGPWRVEPVPVVDGREFGDASLHYPQVVTENGQDFLWFTLREWKSRAFAIFRRPLAGGATEQMLPPMPEMQIGARRVLPSWPGLGRLNRWANQAVHGGRFYLGYAHPHLLGSADSGDLFYHAYHMAGSGAWMDIGRCRLEGGRDVDQRCVFAPAEAPSAWDHHFVADPFVLRV